MGVTRRRANARPSPSRHRGYALPTTGRDRSKRSWMRLPVGWGVVPEDLVTSPSGPPWTRKPPGRVALRKTAALHMRALGIDRWRGRRALAQGRLAARACGLRRGRRASAPAATDRAVRPYRATEGARRNAAQRPWLDSQVTVAAGAAERSSPRRDPRLRARLRLNWRRRSPSCARCAGTLVSRRPSRARTRTEAADCLRDVRRTRPNSA